MQNRGRHFLALAQVAVYPCAELCYGTGIERVPAPSPLQFYREYVASNKPVIIVVSRLRGGNGSANI